MYIIFRCGFINRLLFKRFKWATMNQSKELIRLAEDELISGEYKKNLYSLSVPCPLPTFRYGDNTLFHTAGRAAGSFDFFLTIRKTTSQNAYFHIPFCRSECLYCSYEKITNPSNDLMDQYLDSLQWEIDRKKSLLGESLRPDIFYIGGGTPTILPLKTMAQLLRILDNAFMLHSNLEFTIETTPQAVLAADGEDKLQLFREMGVNRINVGVQSFSAATARRNGRNQTMKDIFDCFDRLRSVGFDKINLDLIYGLVGHTPEIWADDLKMATAISPDSITTFSLRVRPGSTLHSLLQSGKIQPVPEDDLLVMRIMAQRFLTEQGYMEDNSDYFIRSPEKRYLYQPFQPHNIDRNLIGFGPSAYSLAGDRQIFNVRATSDYMQRCSEITDPIGFVVELTPEEFARKRFSEGLRTFFDDRIFTAEFSGSVFGMFPGIISRLQELGLIRIAGPEISLTFKGRILHDHVANYVKFAEAA